MNNKTTLLIVEDDKAIVHFISSILSVNEYRTLYAGTGREAIALIASYRPDVVLLDLGLPDIDGLDVLKTVRQWSEVPIIVVSARGREQEKVEIDYIQKKHVKKPGGAKPGFVVYYTNYSMMIDSNISKIKQVHD